MRMTLENEVSTTSWPKLPMVFYSLQRFIPIFLFVYIFAGPIWLIVNPNLQFSESLFFTYLYTMIILIILTSIILILMLFRFQMELVEYILERYSSKTAIKSRTIQDSKVKYWVLAFIVTGNLVLVFTTQNYMVKSICIIIISFSIFFAKDLRVLHSRDAIRMVNPDVYRSEIENVFCEYILDVLQTNIVTDIPITYVIDEHKEYSFATFSYGLLRISFNPDPSRDISNETADIGVKMMIRGNFLIHNMDELIVELYNKHKINRWSNRTKKSRNRNSLIGKPHLSTMERGHLKTNDTVFDKLYMIFTKPKKRPSILKFYITDNLKQLLVDQEINDNLVESITLFPDKVEIVFTKIRTDSVFILADLLISEYLYGLDPFLFDFKSKDNDDTCQICYQPIGEDQATAITTCCEVEYHDDHIRTWLDSERKCPNCRKQITKYQLN